MRVMRVTAVMYDGAKSRRREREFDALRGALESIYPRALCFSRDFPWREELINLGYREMSVAPLFESLMPRVAAALSKTGSTAAIVASRIGTVERRILDALCLNYRYVLADTRMGGRVFDEYRRKLGLSVLPLNPDTVARCDAAFFCAKSDMPLRLPDKCVAMAADDTALRGVTYNLRVRQLRYDVDCGDLPGGFSRDEIVSAAIDCGAISASDIRLTGVGYAKTV
jgi:hypothetical protein